MKVVDHRVPSHYQADRCPHPDKHNSFGDWWMTMPKYSTHGHHWKLKNLLTQSQICVGQLVCCNINFDVRTLHSSWIYWHFLWCFSIHKQLSNGKSLLFRNSLIGSGKHYFIHIYFWKKYTVYWQDVSLVAIQSRAEMWVVSQTGLSLVSHSVNVSNQRQRSFIIREVAHRDVA